jgi:hypothetical protein
MDDSRHFLSINLAAPRAGLVVESSVVPDMEGPRALSTGRLYKNSDGGWPEGP